MLKMSSEEIPPKFANYIPATAYKPNGDLQKIQMPVEAFVRVFTKSLFDRAPEYKIVTLVWDNKFHSIKISGTRLYGTMVYDAQKNIYVENTDRLLGHKEMAVDFIWPIPLEKEEEKKQKVQLKGIACDQCTVGKRKCDINLPSCERCVMTGKTCTRSRMKIQKIQDYLSGENKSSKKQKCGDRVAELKRKEYTPELSKERKKACDSSDCRWSVYNNWTVDKSDKLVNRKSAKCVKNTQREHTEQFKYHCLNKAHPLKKSAYNATSKKQREEACNARTYSWQHGGLIQRCAWRDYPLTFDNKTNGRCVVLTPRVAYSMNVPYPYVTEEPAEQKKKRMDDEAVQKAEYTKQIEEFDSFLKSL